MDLDADPVCQRVLPHGLRRGGKGWSPAFRRSFQPAEAGASSDRDVGVYVAAVTTARHNTIPVQDKGEPT